MLEIKNLHAIVAEDQREILKGIDLTVKPGAVSYTHLDVYKRQAH